MKQLAFCLFSMLMIVAALPVQAGDFFITSVIREFPMHSGDTVVKDYYINAGANNGLKKGASIDAVRKISGFDNINSKLLGDMPVHIAKLKIIYVDKTVSIARMVKVYGKDVTPLTGYDDVMIGDIIEVSEKQ